jgi:predicted molibdopterin-dependent oxidoreductase YjgC
MLEAAAAGELDVLVLLGADLFDVPDRDLATRVLASTKVIAIDLFETPTTALADVVLPAAGYAECDGTTTNLEGRVSSVAGCITPPGTARAPWMIAAELAWRLDGDLGVESVTSIWDEIAAVAPSHRGITSLVLRSPLAAAGVVAPLGDPEEFLADMSTPVMIGVGAVAPGAPPTSHLVAPRHDGPDEEGTSTALETPLADESALPPLLSFAAPAPTEVPPVDSYSLRLVATRELYDAGTLVAHSPSLANLARGPIVNVNPYDFDRLGVHPGEHVRVSSAQVSFTVAANSDPGVPRGCAAMVFNQPDLAVASLIESDSVVTDVRVETLEQVR